MSPITAINLVYTRLSVYLGTGLREESKLEKQFFFRGTFRVDSPLTHTPLSTPLRYVYSNLNGIFAWLFESIVFVRV